MFINKFTKEQGSSGYTESTSFRKEDGHRFCKRTEPYPLSPSSYVPLLSAFDGIVPPHFYGVMAKTDVGCQVLQDKGHFGEFAEFIRLHGLESEDQDMILKLKSVLWAVVR